MDVLSSPSSSSLGVPLVRSRGDYTEHYSRFLIRNPTYGLQYSHIYQKRLALLRPLVLATAESRWPATGGRRE